MSNFSSRDRNSGESSKNENVSFLQFKYELNKIFFDGGDLRINTDDFWLFVKKYEEVKKRAEELKVPAKEQIEKNLLLNLSLTESSEKFFSKLSFREDRIGKITVKLIDDFKIVVLSYLDFKQKENFIKLKKLRKAQEDLPVHQFKEDIVQSVADNRVVIVAGDTGCGKSTQVPRYLLNAGFQKIACTQPRRIACISLSKRVAYETLNEFGAEVGYQIRFERKRRQETKIVFITEGLLLRQLEGDGALDNYDIVVLDEVHERHIHGDFLLGILKCLLIQRETFKLILMSATINLNLFADYFGGNAKVIQVPGRLHPIKIHYSPVSEEELRTKSDRLNPAPYVRVLQLIDKNYPREDRGDVLMFMSGLGEIEAVVDAAKQYNEKVQRWIVLPLHSTLSLAEQDKVFDYPPEGFRKCVVSTNIAETSVTIDGIRFVVDSGMVKEMSYDPVCRMERLKEFWVSQASAEQRKGRAGRTGPGLCYRLYSEADFTAMQEYSTPEIQRVPLDSLLLQMVTMGLPDARKDLEAETARRSLESDHGDPIMLLNALREWLEVKQEGGSGRDRVSSRQWCRRRAFEEQRFYEMIKLRRQFKDLLKDCKLLGEERGKLEGLSSAERALRHGEVKLLKSLKRKEAEKGRESKRKMLRPEGWYIEQEETEGGTDLRDVDFRLSHDHSQLQKLVSGSSACSYRDLTMLKIIMCSGLYPQLAVADEFNHVKGPSEQMFHTQTKPFVCLHPNSYFGTHGQVLQLKESDIVQAPGFGARNPLSSRHQLLAYMSLLETSKPYLVNTLRMPTAQTLLLFSSQIQTNSDFSMIICDSWILLKFPAGEIGEKLIKRIVKLRHQWDRLLSLRLKEEEREGEERLEEELARGLPQVMNTEVMYSVKRLLAVSLPTLYLGPSSGLEAEEGPNPFLSSFPITPNPTLGGLLLTPYLTYSCLVEEPKSWEVWRCSYCSLAAPLSPLQRLQHSVTCSHPEQNADEKEDIPTPRKPNSKLYICPDCHQELYLTPVEILKHKKTHSRSN